MFYFFIEGRRDMTQRTKYLESCFSDSDLIIAEDLNYYLSYLVASLGTVLIANLFIGRLLYAPELSPLLKICTHVYM